jgi:hypothetical protein
VLSALGCSVSGTVAAMLRWWSTLFWAAANVLLGICAILPIGLGLALVRGSATSYAIGDQKASAAGIVLLTLLVLGGLFALVNVPFFRRTPNPARYAVWPVAAVLGLAPFAVASWT